MPYILIIMSVDISYLSGSPVRPLTEPLNGQGLQNLFDCSAGLHIAFGRVIHSHMLLSGYVA